MSELRQLSELRQRSELEKRGLVPSNTVTNGKRLRTLEITVQGLERAIVNISDARGGLGEAQDEHNRRYSPYGNEREFAYEAEELEVARCGQVLQRMMIADRERITEFIRAHTSKSDVSTEERMNLVAAGADFEVLEEYLEAKYTRAQMRLMDVHK